MKPRDFKERMFKPDRVMAGQLGLPSDFKKRLGARTFLTNILFFCLLLCCACTFRSSRVV